MYDDTEIVEHHKAVTLRVASGKELQLVAKPDIDDWKITELYEKLNEVSTDHVDIEISTISHVKAKEKRKK